MQEEIIWTHIQGTPRLKHKCRYWPQHTFIAWVPLYGVFIPKRNLTMQQSYSREFFIESHHCQLLQCVWLLCLCNTDDFQSLYLHDAPCPARSCEFGCSICTSTSCSRGMHTELSELSVHYNTPMLSGQHPNQKCLRVYGNACWLPLDYHQYNFPSLLSAECEFPSSVKRADVIPPSPNTHCFGTLLKAQLCSFVGFIHSFLVDLVQQLYSLLTHDRKNRRNYPNFLSPSPILPL